MPKKPVAPPEAESSVLVTAAKAIGSVAGKVASLVGVADEAKPNTKSTKVPKLVKKDKHRLPRRQKKAQQKKSA